MLTFVVQVGSIAIVSEEKMKRKKKEQMQDFQFNADHTDRKMNIWPFLPTPHQKELKLGICTQIMNTLLIYANVCGRYKTSSRVTNEALRTMYLKKNYVKTIIVRTTSFQT